MKILQINKFHYIRGGSDKMYLDTSELLESKGNKVIHFSTKDENNLFSPTQKYFVENPNFLRLGLFNKVLKSVKYIYSKEAKSKLEELIEVEQPDVVHLHIFFGELSLSILPVLKKYNIPTVMSLHEYKLLCPVYTLFDNNSQICHKCTSANYIPCVLNKCTKNSLGNSVIAALESTIRDLFIPYDHYIDHFIAVSKFSMNKHIELRPKLNGKVSYLHNFINYTPVSNPVRGENYIYFGRLSREKGLTTLIKSFSKLKHLKLKIIGAGIERKSLKKICSRDNITNISFVGQMQGEELKKAIIEAKFAIMPSEWFETFGLTVIESMMCGTPVITSGLGGMSELVVSGKTGFVFEPGSINSLTQVVHDSNNMSKENYMSMCSNCINFAANNFRSADYYKNLMSIYLKTIRNKNDK